MQITGVHKRYCPFLCNCNEEIYTDPGVLRYPRLKSFKARPVLILLPLPLNLLPEHFKQFLLSRLVEISSGDAKKKGDKLKIPAN